MATIQDYLNSIMKAVYGKDVRRSIHDAIKQCYEDATGNPESVAGVVQNMEDMSERMNTLEDIYAAKGTVQQANIIDLPDDVFAKPNFEESGVYYVNKSLDNVIVKPAILCFGAYYLFPYTINIDGGTADLPTITGTGVTAVEFRRQWRYSNTNIPTDVTVRVAELGTQYTDYKGEKVTAIGGAGYSSAAKISGYNGMIFFCFSFTFSSIIRRRETVFVLFLFMSPVCLFLTGFSWPVSSFPTFWKLFSYIFPSTFASQAFINMNTAGASLSMAAPQIVALTIQIAVYYLLSCIAVFVENHMLKSRTAQARQSISSGI